MKETILQKNIKIPYSLHDRRIDKIEIIEKNIKLNFECGFTETSEPYNQVEGAIIIENVDFDFGNIYLLSNNGSYGNFTGKKMDIRNFLKEYKNYYLEVVDELYGYNTVQYSGYLTLPKKVDLIEYSMSFYYTGNLVYYTEK